MAIKSFQRYEKKFILNETQYKKLLPILYEYMNEDKFCKNGENYNIYSIYYDTLDNQVIRHSINKPYYKEKLRLRSYKAPIGENDKVFLELKKKINGIVNKRRATLTLKEAYKFLEDRIRPKSLDFLNNQVLDEIEYYLNNNEVSPRVYISYSRKAFFGKNDKYFRITFDSNILGRRDNLSLQLGLYGENLLPRDSYLMEVKILGAIPIWLSKTMSELEIYNTHFSKYGSEYVKYCLNNNCNSRRKNIC